MKCNLSKFTALSILLACLVAVFLPALQHCGGENIRRAKIASCVGNLAQLHKLGFVYAAKFEQWPAAKEEDFWRSLARTTPRLIAPEHEGLFLCPLRDEEPSPGECHYRGPRLPWAQLNAGDPIAADKEGNHGGESINVLLKSGDLVQATPGDPLWKKCRELLGP